MTKGLADIGAEGVLLAGAGRAILLQLADPSIGRGIAEHSDFAGRPIDRLLGTMTYVYAVVYGNAQQVASVRRRVNRAHAPVRGEGEGGQGYSAYDAASQVWVVATLYDTAVTVYERVFGPMDDQSADRIYREYAVLGSALQMPADHWPADRAAFAKYWQRRMTELRADPATRAVARHLLYPSTGPLWLRLSMPLARLLTTGFAPQQLRDQFGLSWGPAHRGAFTGLMLFTRLIYPRVPRPFRNAFRDYCLSRLDKPSKVKGA